MVIVSFLIFSTIFCIRSGDDFELKERWKSGFELKEMWRNNYELKERWMSDLIYFQNQLHFINILYINILFYFYFILIFIIL